MDPISRRSAIQAMVVLPAAGIAATTAAAGPNPAWPAGTSARAQAEWHYAELVRLLDQMEPTELHVVLQRTRDVGD